MVTRVGYFVEPLAFIGLALLTSPMLSKSSSTTGLLMYAGTSGVAVSLCNRCESHDTKIIKLKTAMLALATISTPAFTKTVLKNRVTLSFTDAAILGATYWMVVAAAQMVVDLINDP